jgi:hypothetical protein
MKEKYVRKNNIKEDIKGSRRDVDCIQLVLVMDQWRSLVNVVLNLPVPSNEGNFLSI